MNYLQVTGFTKIIVIRTFHIKKGLLIKILQWAMSKPPFKSFPVNTELTLLAPQNYM